MEWLELILQFFRDLFSFNEESPLLFTQFYFWAFFALVYALFALFKSKRLLRNAFLFFVSLFFYYRTSGIFVLILIFVTFSDFFFAKGINRAKSRGGKRAFLVCSIVVDLFLLCYFKYSYFFSDMLHSMFGWNIRVFDIFSYVGNAMTGTQMFNVDQIVLPVGISFFTFQLISYTVDVYRGQVAPVKNILDFGFYVSFFPQLVAGPIVRASEFIPQLYRPFRLSRKGFGVAIFWILNGLIKKIVLSDYIAVNFVDRVFDSPLLFSGFENFAALIAYSLQVYADFSGYTDIAIGVAALMGFHLPQNFNSPYKAPNPQNFWKRWHMSLSRWLQSYVYIPLGGNRNTTFGTYFWIILFAVIGTILSGTYWTAVGIVTFAAVVLLVARFAPSRRKKIIANVNSFITMLLGGLWHGASWNFLIWGGLNGIGMIVYKGWKDMKWGWRLVLLGLVTALLELLRILRPAPVWNLFFVWMLFIDLGTVVRFVFHIFCPCAEGADPKGRSKLNRTWTAKLGNVWAIAQTFMFISFTRLFFRSGSNLDPAVANEVAWNTAKNMVSQIGSAWDLAVIPDILLTYWKVFALVIVGLIIHWLPVRWKKWYRLNFAMLPIPVIALIVVVVVFLLYQFTTAGFQPFIYFQF